MKTLIVHAHPEPTSFNAALTETAVATLTAAGHAVEVSDLYAANFSATAGRHDFVGAADPDRFDYQAEQRHAVVNGTFADDLRREQERVLWCDLLILQFPLWWFGPPAILKGWIDRVMAYKFAYDSENRFERGYLRGRRAMVSVTTGGTVDRFDADGLYGEIAPYLRPIEFGVLRYVGMEVAAPFIAYAAPRVPADQRRAYLADYGARLLALADADVLLETPGDGDPGPEAEPG